VNYAALIEQEYPILIVKILDGDNQYADTVMVRFVFNLEGHSQRLPGGEVLVSGAPDTQEPLITLSARFQQIQNESGTEVIKGMADIFVRTTSAIHLEINGMMGR
jgi:hypothetical protein